MPAFLQEIFGPLAHSVLVAIRILVIFILFFLALRFIDSALKRLFVYVTHAGAIRTPRLEQRAETLRQSARSVSRTLLSIVLLIAIATELGFWSVIGPALAIGGLASLAIGFGAQSLVKDVISGFFILLEDQYGVGDVVRIGQQDGVVERMTLRVTQLRNLEGNVHVIPNGNIQTVTVLTKDWARAVLDVTVLQKENLDHVFQVMREVGDGLFRDLPKLVLEKPQVLGIERWSEDGITIRAMVKTPPLQQAELLREWRLRLKAAFDREGIEMPQKGIQPKV